MNNCTVLLRARLVHCFPALCVNLSAHLVLCLPMFRLPVLGSHMVTLCPPCVTHPRDVASPFPFKVVRDFDCVFLARICPKQWRLVPLVSRGAACTIVCSNTLLYLQMRVLSWKFIYDLVVQMWYAVHQRFFIIKKT